MKGLRPYILALFSGLILILIYPNYLRLPLGCLAWIALVPLLAATKGDSPKRAFWKGATTGLGYLGILPWIVYCVTTYAEMSAAMGVTLLVLLTAVMAAYLGAAMAMTTYITDRYNMPLIIAFPICWVAIELARSHFPFGGFTWAILGYSQHKALPVIQIAEITGVYGVSALVLMVNAAVYTGLAKYLLQKKPDWPSLEWLWEPWPCAWPSALSASARWTAHSSPRKMSR